MNKTYKLYLNIFLAYFVSNNYHFFFNFVCKLYENGNSRILDQNFKVSNHSSRTFIFTLIVIIEPVGMTNKISFSNNNLTTDPTVIIKC